MPPIGLGHTALIAGGHDDLASLNKNVWIDFVDLSGFYRRKGNEDLR